MSIEPINLKKLYQTFDNMTIHGVKYGLGDKAPRLDCDTSEVKRIDCSGFVRYAIAKATNQKLIIPDGSWIQNDWCRSQGFPKKNYADLHYADHSRLFIAFIRAGRNGAGRIGHVWFINQMDKDWPVETMESYGGHGVGSRRWDNSTLRRLVFECFELPTS